MTTLPEHDKERLLAQLLDGELSATEMAQAEEVLRGDERFAAALKQHRALQERLRGLRNPELPAGFEARLAARLAAVPPSPWEVLVRMLGSWRVPLVLSGALAAGAVMMLWQVPATAPNGVAASGMVMAPGAAVEVTLRLRAGAAQWGSVTTALRGAGVRVQGEPAARGGVHVLEAPGNGASVRAAAEALAALLPVEVVGVVPASDVPVRVRVVLVAP